MIYQSFASLVPNTLTVKSMDTLYTIFLSGGLPLFLMEVHENVVFLVLV